MLDFKVGFTGVSGFLALLLSGRLQYQTSSLNASVSGSWNNTASGNGSSVSGGVDCEVNLDLGWAVDDTTEQAGCVISNLRL
jgi:hypothetical protein